MTIIYITEIIFTSQYSLPTIFTIIIIIVILHKNDQRAGDGEIKILLLLVSTNEHDKCARGG